MGVGDIPDACGVVARESQQLGSMGQELNSMNGIKMVKQWRNGEAGFQIPDPRPMIGR